jgi:ABC-2 type transport system ATP-binding protein
MPEPAVISVSGLQKSYGEVRAVRDINFEIACGEVFGLLGPNGAGKTTTVEILEGLRERDGGAVLVCGLDPASQGRELKERIGIQLQQTALPEKITVGEALDLFASFYRKRLQPRELLDWFGLQEKRGSFYENLSGGQQQRLALARAWATQPEVLFLDEPTASLDPGAKREVETLIESFARDDGVAIVMSTHNLGQAKRLGTRVVYLDAGRVLVDLPTAMFFYEPLPDAAAQFVRGELPWSELRQPQQAQQQQPLQRP